MGWIDVIIQHVEHEVHEMNSVIPGIFEGGQIILSVLTSLYGWLCEQGSTCMISEIKAGMVILFICRDAQTLDVHIDMDFSYTLIYIPFVWSSFNETGEFVFEFYFNWWAKIDIHPRNGTCLYCSGYGIMNRKI